MTELEQKAADINAANNKLVADMQAENERRLKGFINESQFKDLQETFQRRWDAQEVEIARLKTPQMKGAGDFEPTLHHKAYGKYLRQGAGKLTPEETKALTSMEIGNGEGIEKKVLTIADTTHAGVLAPAEYVNEIVRYSTLYHPMRTLATVRQTDQFSVQVPTETAIGVGTWEAESATKTETTGLTYAITTIIPQEMKILYLATQKMLEDSQFNLEAEIAQAAGRAFGRLEGAAFYGGNGTTTGPEGISVNATVLADGWPVATDNTIVLDDFFKASYALSSVYAGQAAWVLNRTTLGMITQLKNATTNQYLLQPNLQEGQPLRLLGNPIYEWTDFPAHTDATPADGEIIAALGDFKRGYYIVDRVGMTVQRLNELYAAAGMVGFYVRARVGGGVVVPEAIQLLKNITT